MRAGYILLHRQGITPDEWKTPARTLAWFDLLTMVDYKTGNVTINYSFYERRWRKGRSTIFKWVQYWKGERMIEQTGEHDGERNGERFFVVNYAKYQRSGEQEGERTSEQEGEQKSEPRKKVSNIPLKELSNKKPEKIDFKKLESEFKRILVEHHWCDEHYANKTWDQGLELNGTHRENFLRKVALVLSSAKHERTISFAKKVYHEIAGMVNDFGAMNKGVSAQELHSRELFKEDTGHDL